LKSFFNKLGWQDWLVIALMAYAFIQRLSHLDPVPFAIDLQRDRLVANHILHFREFPWIGPSNSALGSTVIAIPYYTEALILFIYNSLLFLNFANLLLQILSIWLVYSIAKSLFSREVGVLSGLLFTFSSVAFHQSLFFYQPFVAQAILLSSFYLFLLAYKRLEIKFLITALFLYAVSSAWHISILGILPIIIFISGLTLKKMGCKFKVYFYLTVFYSFFGILIFLPMVLGLFKSKSSVDPSVSTYNNSLVSYTHSLAMHVTYFAGSTFSFPRQTAVAIQATDIFPDSSSSLFTKDLWIEQVQNLSSAIKKYHYNILYSFGVWLFLLWVLLLPIYFKIKQERQKKQIMILFLLTFACELFIASIIKLNYYSFWNYTPIFTLLIMAVAELFISLLIRNAFLKVCLVIVSIFLLFSFGYSTQVVEINRSFISTFRGSSYDSTEAINPLVFSIEQYLKQESSEKALHNFNVLAYVQWPTSSTFITNPYIWNELESHFGTKFVEISTQWPGYSVINKDDTIFLICDSKYEKNAYLTFKKCILVFHCLKLYISAGVI
jgi:hypothetical protein